MANIGPGTQSFSLKIAEEMIPGSIHLEAPVSRISQNSSGATVVTEDDTKYHCKKVIVSIPTPSYKNIRFSPPLPLDKLKYSSGTTLGYYAKLILVWEKQWWKELGYCGMSQSFVGPAAVIRDTSDEALGVFSLTCFVTGEPGRHWSKLSLEGRKEAALKQLEELYGKGNSETIRSPLEVFEQEWVKDAWSQGCPCPFAPPNLMTEVGAALRAPFGALHFAGTETSFEWKGYMEGAVRAGERGAEEVVQALAEKGSKFPAKL
jgi:monoamine oxidase